MAQSATAAPPSSGFWQEMESFKTPQQKDVAPLPTVGSPAPSSSKITIPDPKGRPTIILFLRHCGCPFAEISFKQLTALSNELSDDIHFVAVSHSSASATERWIPQVGGTWGVDVVVDEERDVYAQWGLGLSSTWHILSPRVFLSAIRVAVNEGVWNRPTESGSRWQLSGAFAVDGQGIVRWLHVGETADALPDLRAGVEALGVTYPTKI